MVLRAHTYNDHLADVPAAELRVRGILHIEHPAGDENAQPCQEKVLHLNGWETALVVGRDKRVGEKRMRNHCGNKPPNHNHSKVTRIADVLCDQKKIKIIIIQKKIPSFIL